MAKELFGFNTDNEWDYENGFYLTSHVTRTAKMLAHFELYKSIIDLPGHIVECGVYKGASFVRFATFREILESPYSREIIGFDTFGKFPQYEDQDPNDATFISKFEQAGGIGISVDELRRVFEHKSLCNYQLVQGDILITVPQYIDRHPELKIALLHMDVVVYRPSAAILNLLYDRVVKGGLIVLDDYGTGAGETRAVDEFMTGKDVVIEKLPISHIPAFIRK